MSCKYLQLLNMIVFLFFKSLRSLPGQNHGEEKCSKPTKTIITLKNRFDFKRCSFIGLPVHLTRLPKPVILYTIVVNFWNIDAKTWIFDVISVCQTFQNETHKCVMNCQEKMNLFANANWRYRGSYIARLLKNPKTYDSTASLFQEYAIFL